MPHNIFLPPLDSQWRFGADWTPTGEFLSSSYNEETLWGWSGRYSGSIEAWKKATGDNTNDDAHAPGGWLDRLRTWEAKFKEEYGTPEFVAGTIFQMERYHISRSGEDQITVKVLLSPDKRLTPKKQGGIMRGAGRLYFSLAQFNTLPDLEQVHDLS